MKEKLNIMKKWKPISIGVVAFVLILGLAFGNSNQDKINELETSVQTLQEQNEELQSENDVLTADISGLSAENGELQLQITEKDQTIDSLNEELGTVEGYEQQIADLETQIVSLTEENSKLQSEIDGYKKASTESSVSRSENSGSPTIESSDNTASTSVGTTVYITKTGDKYHRGSCSYLKKSKIAIDKDAAISQGYGACSRCNP